MQAPAYVRRSRESQCIRGLGIVLGSGLAYFCFDFALNRFAFSNGWSILWPLNGVTVAVLLVLPRRKWPLFLLGVGVGTWAGECRDGNPALFEVGLRLCSLAEVGISALLLPPFTGLGRWLKEPRIFRRFSFALLSGPGLSGMAAAVIMHRAQHLTYRLSFNDWATADALGIAAIMPLLLSLWSVEMASLFRRATWLKTVGLLVGTQILVVVIFSVSSYPLLFLLYPALLYVDSRIGFPGVAILIAGTCLSAVYLTTHGQGPFGMWPAGLFISRDVALQIYLGFHIVALFPFSLLLLERRMMAAELRAANVQLMELVAVDSLTGIANRRALDEWLTQEWKRALRLKSSLGLLMIDIDHFKKFNDEYGHLAGDECLRQIGRCLAQRIQRPQDLVARYGGEEFMVVLPHTLGAGATLVASQLVEDIRALAIPHAGSPWGIVTLSIGCASLVPALGDAESSLMQASDEALYRAKKSGRNRVGAADLAAGEAVGAYHHDMRQGK